MFNIHSAWVVFGILQKEKPDCVMIHTIKGMGYTIPYAVKKTGIPSIHTVHDVQFVMPSGQYMYGENYEGWTSLFLQVYKTLTRLLLGSPHNVVYPSRFLKDFYDVRGFFQKSKKVILQNPVDMPSLLETPLSPKNNEQIHFLYLGQLEKHKGIVFLLDVFKEWHAEDTRLIIAGDGSCRNAVETACRNDKRISFLGYKTGIAREEVFRNAHYLIVPSLCYENAPLVIGEALARGIPAITAKIGGAYERVIEGKNGWVFIPNDIKDCVRVLSESCSAARERYWEISLHAKESVKNDTPERYCSQLLSHGITKNHIGAITSARSKVRE